MDRSLDLSGCSLLAVFAHPDDESIACGGLLAYCAERGARVTLLCATHGESCSGVRDDIMFETRARELAEAARVLGIHELVLGDYPDGFLPWVSKSELEGRIAAEIRRVDPEVVVTFGDDGLYWHPDHIAIHERTTAAIESLGSDAPALYYVTMPPGSMRRIFDEYGGPLNHVQKPLLGVSNPDAFGVAAETPTLIVDVGACAARKLSALKCHRTQVAHGVLQLIPEHDAARLLGIEHFHRATVGAGTKTFIEQL